MIFDKIENLNKYNIDLQYITEDLSKNEFQKGRFEIEGDEKFGIGLEYETKDSKDALWEAHRKNLDIHVLIKGEEIIEIADISVMKSTKDYEDDYELFEGYKEQQVVLKPGYFLLLFPNEVHKTSVFTNENSVHVIKKVYKKRI